MVNRLDSTAAEGVPQAKADDGEPQKGGHDEEVTQIAWKPKQREIITGDP